MKTTINYLNKCNKFGIPRLGKVINLRREQSEGYRYVVVEFEGGEVITFIINKETEKVELNNDYSPFNNWVNISRFYEFEEYSPILTFALFGDSEIDDEVFW